MSATSSPVRLTYEDRLAARLAVRFILDVAAIGRVKDRLLDALLMAAVINANTQPLMRDPALQAAYARMDAPPPDEHRRPVSINALAGSLSLPFETVRRHIKGLVESGLCQLGAHGVVVPTEVLCAPPFILTAISRYRRLVQFYDELVLAGLIEPLPHGLARAEDPTAPIRAATRILSDYFFRLLDAMRCVTPDPLTALVMLEVARSSSEHLTEGQVEAVLRGGWIAGEVRIPVRVAELSRRLGTPYETTRRHIGWLIEQGLCVRTGGGVLTGDDHSRPELVAVMVDNLGNIRRMFRMIAALEVAPAQLRGEAAGG